jgi:hypothetical protein
VAGTTVRPGSDPDAAEVLFDFDFLEILQGAIVERSPFYDVASVFENADLEVAVPMSSATCSTAIRTLRVGHSPEFPRARRTGRSHASCRVLGFPLRCALLIPG